MPSRILIARTDKLGDFMLTWPALALLRQALPAARIDLLVAEPVVAMAHACPYIDEVVVDRQQSLRALGSELGGRRYDAAVALFSNGRVAAALMAAGIGYRLAPATKLAQVLYTRRLTQRRSRSAKPEHEYNTDLVRQLLADFDIACPATPAAPYLDFSPAEREAVATALTARHHIAADAALVLVHPGSGGSASNLAPQHYADLVNHLTSPGPVFVLVTAGPGEEGQADAVVAGINAHPAGAHYSREGLLAFAKTLAVGDVFISGSTGPLHMAGALDVPTAAFYPRRRSATALRWQTTNTAPRRLAFSPPPTAGECDMSAIDRRAAAITISREYLGAHSG